MQKPIYLTTLLWLCLVLNSFANDGYNLWLDYQPISDSQLKSQVEPLLSQVYFYGENPTFEVIRNELNLAADKMLGKTPVYSKDRLQNTKLWIGTTEQLSQTLSLEQQSKIKALGTDGYWRGKV